RSVSARVVTEHWATTAFPWLARLVTTTRIVAVAALVAVVRLKKLVRALVTIRGRTRLLLRHWKPKGEGLPAMTTLKAIRVPAATVWESGPCRIVGTTSTVREALELVVEPMVSVTFTL